jgi:hypothetical protein
MTKQNERSIAPEKQMETKEKNDCFAPWLRFTRKCQASIKVCLQTLDF